MRFGGDSDDYFLRGSRPVPWDVEVVLDRARRSLKMKLEGGRKLPAWRILGGGQVGDYQSYE